MRTVRALALALAASALSCSPANDGGGGGGGGGNGGGNNNPPPGNNPALVVVSTAPDDGELGVGLGTSVLITFNQDINAASVNANTIVFLSQAGPVAGVFTVQGPVVTFNPTVELPGSSPIQGTVTTDVEAASGDRLAQNFVFVFGTNSVVQMIAESANMQQVKVAVSAGGLVMVMWVQNDPGGYRLMARSWEPATGWAPATEVDAQGPAIFSLKMSCTENNEVVAAWSEGSTLPNSNYAILTARFTAGQGWGATETLSLWSGNTVYFTMDRDGWGGIQYGEVSERGYYPVGRFRFLQPDGTWQDEQEVPNTALNDTLMFGTAGDVYSVWYNQSSDSVGVTRYTPAEGWTTQPLLNLASRPEFGCAARPDGHLLYAIDDDGNIELLQFDGTDWNPIDTAPGPGGFAAESDVASALDGEAYLSWIADIGGARNVFGGFLDLDGTWRDVQVLESLGAVPSSLSVACPDTGEGWTVFEQADPAANSIWFARYVPGLGWAPTIELDEDDYPSSKPQVSAQGPGGCAVWIRDLNGTKYLMARIIN